MMYACLAQRTTQLLRAACEPEVVDLAVCLNKMGACIEGIGTNTLTIKGVGHLSGTRHQVIPDRNETGTYILAAAITKGKVHLQDT